MTQLKSINVKLSSLNYLGNALQRPECVLCTKDGSVFTSNWSGGVTHIAPNQEQHNYLAKQSSIDLKPNGFAITGKHSFLLANLGVDGGVWELSKDGKLNPLITRIDGQDLPPCNYVMIDQQERIWISISTRHTPRDKAYRKTIFDGFIICIDGHRARIVTDDLGYVNEVQISPCQNYLYCNETFGQQLSRFAILPNGDLGPKEVITQFANHVFPDGLTFDEEGFAWVTSIISNQVIRVSRDGSQELILEDCEPDHILRAQSAFAITGLSREHLDQTPAKYLKNVSSLAFGGIQRDIAYMGCLLDDKIAFIRAHVRGVKPYHWDLQL